MIRILTIDDEPLALRLLEVYIGRIPDLELLAACTHAEDAMPLLGQADALLIDINMPDISGMDFVKRLDRPPLVIFTTAYAEYAVEGFRVNAVDYLLKPFSFDEFESAVGKLRKILGYRRLQAGQPDGMMTLQTQRHSIRLNAARIRYIEGMGEYLKIHLEGEAAPTVALYRMKRIQEELPPGRFARIHKSYIVNLSHARDIRNHQLTLDDKTTLPIGDSYREAFLREFQKFIS